MTATTVGLGEYGPVTQGGRGFAIVHILVSVIFFGALLGLVLDVRSIIATEHKKDELLKKQLEKLEEAHTTDADGSVSLQEFVMLNQLKVNQNI